LLGDISSQEQVIHGGEEVFVNFILTFFTLNISKGFSGVETSIFASEYN
jgi:hypothetical protein